MRPKLTVASRELCKEIVAEAMRILAETGIEVRGHQLRERLLEHGLRTNTTGERVLFPVHVVEKAIADAPKSIILYDRNGNPHADLGGDRVHFVPGSSGLRVLDHRNGATRPATTADFVEYVRLCNGLEHIAYLATAFSTGDDIEAGVSDAWRLYLCLTNSRRPVVSGAFTEHGVTRMAEMMALFRRDRADLIAHPMSIFTITATGNFRYSEDSCQNLLDCVEWGIPIEIVPVTLMGLIAPVTLVGAAVFHAVDTLAGITMAQVIRPGAPILYGGAPAEFHMREATSPMLGIQALSLDVLNAQVGKHLGLPTQAYMALSDAKELDAQAGAETFGSALLAALSGINSVSGPGMLDYVLVFSLPKLIFDNEVCGQALRMVRDLRVVDDLPTSALVAAQMSEGHMVTARHTLAHWPEQLYMPGPIFDRKNSEAWERDGRKSLWVRACEEVETRLAAYQPLDTDPALDAEMRRLIYSGMKTVRPLPDVPAHVADIAAPVRRGRRQRHQPTTDAAKPSLG
jgi:trimethylamine--corrinoid protein Co-methyltransferase